MNFFLYTKRDFLSFSNNFIIFVCKYKDVFTYQDGARYLKKKKTLQHCSSRMGYIPETKKKMEINFIFNKK